MRADFRWLGLCLFLCLALPGGSAWGQGSWNPWSSRTAKSQSDPFLEMEASEDVQPAVHDAEEAPEIQPTAGVASRRRATVTHPEEMLEEGEFTDETMPRTFDRDVGVNVNAPLPDGQEPVERTTFNPQISTDMPWDDLSEEDLPERLYDNPDPEAEELRHSPPQMQTVFLQLLKDTGATVTWLAPADDFAVTELGFRTQDTLPIFFLGGPPPKIASGVGISFLDAPAELGLPSQLYSVNLELRWMRPINDRMVLEIAAGPGWFSDFSGGATQGLRATGRVMLLWGLSEQWQTALGIVYLGRQGLPAIPAVGAIWTPNADTRVEITMPRPRVARRISNSETRQNWVYAGCELFGGNSWSIGRPDGSEDIFQYTDYRLLLGIETISKTGLTARLEAGYVFSRSIQFRDDPLRFNPGDTAMLRASVSF